MLFVHVGDAAELMMKIPGQLGTSRGRYDEHNSKFPSVRTEVCRIKEEEAKLRR
jgi:hypothetical protein